MSPGCLAVRPVTCGQVVKPEEKRKRFLLNSVSISESLIQLLVCVCVRTLTKVPVCASQRGREEDAERDLDVAPNLEDKGRISGLKTCSQARCGRRSSTSMRPCLCWDFFVLFCLFRVLF